MSVQGPQASLIHILYVVSRSGRASAEIGRVDLDDTDEELSEVASRMAAVAHHPVRDAEKHTDLNQALFEALKEVERIPGQPVEAIATLDDGRRVRVERIIGY